MSCKMDEYIVTSLFNKNSVGKDKCDICEQKNTINCCDKCGNGICYNCCLAFPHHYDTLFVICNKCSDEIGRKFSPNLIIDVSKLKLLKQKIKKNKTYAKRKRVNNK